MPVQFSVIIPTFNRLELLQEALASVRSQAFRDFELLIIDDGSTDNTASFLRSLGGEARVFHQPHLGPGAARNLGIEHSEGEYFAFLDSDDLWFPWTLQTYASVIGRHDRPSFVSGRSLPFGQAPEPGDADPASAVRTQRHPSLLDACDGTMPPVGGSPGICVRAEAVRAVGGFCSRRTNAEDVDLWLRLGDAPGFVQIESPPVFAQRKHDANISLDTERNIGGAHFLADQERSGAYPGGDSFRLARIRIIAANARSVILQCLDQGHAAQAWTLYRKTLSWQMELRKWRFLMAVPFLAVLALLRLGSKVGDKVANRPLTQ